MRVLCALVLTLCLAAAAGAEMVRVPVSADAGVTSERGRLDENSGASVTVPIRQNQNWSGFETKACLMRFDTGDIRGRSVERAWLNIFLARGDLFGIGLCSVLAGWEEGSGLNFQTGRGGASWNWASEPDDPENPEAENYWAWPGSEIYSVSWAHPDLRYQHIGRWDIRKKELGEGILHLRMPVDPELVEMLSTGLAGGLLLTDDKGQVAEGRSLKGRGTPYRYNHAEDIWMFTGDIQDPELRPFLEVELAPADNEAPGAVTALRVVESDPFGHTATLSFTAPSDNGGGVLGYDIRYAPDGAAVSEAGWEELDRLPLWTAPRPAAPGDRQRMLVKGLAPGSYTLGIRAVDRSGNPGPVATVAVSIPRTPEVSFAAPPRDEPAGAAPAPAAAGAQLELWACSDLTKVEPTSGKVLRDGENYIDDPGIKDSNPVWSAKACKVHLRAARGEVVAFKLLLERVGGAELSDIRVAVSRLSGDRGGSIDAARDVSLFRVWYMDVEPRSEELLGPWELVEEKDHRPAWHGDACLPLGEPFESGFSLPTMDNIGPDQRLQAVWVDVFIPNGTRPGRYSGRITVSAAELAEPLHAELEIEVLPLEIPEEVSWIVELNAYDYGLTSLTGVAISDEPERFLRIEKRSYQLARLHRATLNVLPYSQGGNVAPMSAPPVRGTGPQADVVSWKQWDERYGKYLTGKAFTPSEGYHGPGEGVPLEHMYLPFHENWPMTIRDNYADYQHLVDRMDFVRWATESQPLEKAFYSRYQEGITEISREFFEHFRKKGYSSTRFQFYYNNKYYFKVNFFRMPDEGHGTSFWLLDEPVDYDDYAANRFYLSLVKKGYDLADGAGKPPAHFRTDVSQPEMSRGLWDGICNLWNSSGLRDFASTADFRMKRIEGEQYWHYGGGPRISSPLVEMHRNFFTYWSMGTTGELPYWDSLRGEGWFRPSDLAVFYKGTDYARSGRDYDGTLPGVRMKVIRRAQQDIEYLMLLAGKPGWSRESVTHALAGTAGDMYEPAGTRFSGLTVDRLFELRSALQQTLMELQ